MITNAVIIVWHYSGTLKDCILSDSFSQSVRPDVLNAVTAVRFLLPPKTLSYSQTSTCLIWSGLFPHTALLSDVVFREYSTQVQKNVSDIIVFKLMSCGVCQCADVCCFSLLCLFLLLIVLCPFVQDISLYLDECINAYQTPRFITEATIP